MMHLYRYRLKSFLLNKEYMFWTLAFPLLLATFFGLSFGRLVKQTATLEPVPVAIVVRQANPSFSQTVEQLSAGDDAILAPVYTGEQEALALLESSEVAGIFYVGQNLELFFAESGLNQSILKAVVDSFLQAEATIGRLAEINPAAIPAALNSLTNFSSATRQVGFSGDGLNNMLHFFYALLAMTSLYGGFFGLSSVISIQPSQSPLGLRRAITPTKKTALVFCDLAASVSIVFAEVLLTAAYIRFVLGIPLGSALPAVLSLCFGGCLCGVLLGMAVGAMLPFKETAKEGILIILSLLMSFFSGLMYSGMWELVERYFPPLNRVNPAALLVDGLYALQIYGIGQRYWLNLASLGAICALLAAGCIAVLRRRQYASV